MSIRLMSPAQLGVRLDELDEPRAARDERGGQFRQHHA